MLSKEIEKLYEAVTQEADSKKLLSRVEQLNDALARTPETSSSGETVDAGADGRKSNHPSTAYCGLAVILAR